MSKEYMEKLSTIEAIAEQLAAGNKLNSLKKIIEVDLVKQTKRTTIEATVQKLVLPTGAEFPFIAEANDWLSRYLPDHTTIHIRGKNGRFATLPYSQKDSLMDNIIKLFNS